MSANYEATQRYFELLEQVKEYLPKSWLKRDTTKFNTSSVAITGSAKYFSGLAESKTHLLDITSEQAAIVQAVSAKDAHIKEVISVVDGEFMLNPIVIKVLADHIRRTGTPIAYRVFDKNGSELYSCDNVHTLYYKPKIKVLEKIKNWMPRANKIKVDETKDIKEQLHECALRGMKTHFSSDTKTSYGAAILAEDTIYFGGVYGSFDHRMNLHAEMVSAMSAFADGKTKISWIGLVSNKFVNETPQMCGCCRQFFAEIEVKTKVPIRFVAFSYDSTKEFEIKLADYLPHPWDSGKALEDR